MTWIQKFTAAVLMPVLLAASAVGNDRPNVVLILADDLGYGDLGCYGATKVQTPNIDRLARQGRRFTDAHSPCSVCTPTRYNLLTGRYAWRTWVRSSCVWANDPLLIDENRLTLGDLFQSQGYRTACIGKWHLGFGKPGTVGWDDVLGPDYNAPLRPGPVDCGFDYFWGFPHVGQLPHVIIENRRVLGLDANDPMRITPDSRAGYELDYLARPRNGWTARLGTEGGKSAKYAHEDLALMLTERAVSWLQQQTPEKPFFLYWPHRNIHGPLIPNPRFRSKNEVGVYGNFLSELDWSVGRVLTTLDEMGLADDTLVIFTSDNGGVVKYEPIDRAEINGHYVNGPLRGQKTDVFEGGVRVPLIARWPGEIDPGTEDHSLIALTDMLATFADFFDVALPEDAGEDSFSCLGALLGRATDHPARSSLVCDSFLGMMSIRKGEWKLILGQHGGGANTESIENDESLPAGQLYHLGRDLAESENLYETRPDKVQELTGLLRRIQEDGRSRPDTPGPTRDSDSHPRGN